MTIAQKQTLAKQAFALMEQHQLVPNPENYAIWFHYAEGKNTELIREVDAIFLNRLPFNEESTSYLYNKYITSKLQEKKVEDVAGDTQKVLAEVQKMVAEFSGETINYNKGIDKALTDISQNLDKVMDETYFAAKDFTSINLNDQSIDKKIYNAVSGTAAFLNDERKYVEKQTPTEASACY